MNLSPSINGIASKLFIVVSILIIIVLLVWDKTYPDIESSNLDKQNFHPKELKQIVLDFNRKIDENSLESGFKIEPHINWRFSYFWKKVAYTFEQWLEYWVSYKVSMSSLNDTNWVSAKSDIEFSIDTINWQLIYIWTKWNEIWKLIKYDLENWDKEVLVDDLWVWDYKVHPSKKYIYFLWSNDLNRDKYLDEIQWWNGIVSVRNLYKLNLDDKNIDTIFDWNSYIFDFTISNSWNLIAIDRVLLNKFNQEDERAVWTYKHYAWELNIIKTEEFIWYPLHISPDESLLLSFAADWAVLTDIRNPDKPKIFLWNFFDSFWFTTSWDNIIFTALDDDSRFNDKKHFVVIWNDQKEKRVLSWIWFFTNPIVNNNSIYFLLSEEVEWEYEIPVFNLMKYDIDSGLLSSLTKYNDYSVENYSISNDWSIIIIERIRIPKELRYEDFLWDLKNRKNTEFLLLNENEGIGIEWFSIDFY